MDSAKAKTASSAGDQSSVKVGPVIPGPAVPKKVLESNATTTPQPVQEKKDASSELLDRKVPKYKDEKPVGTITLYVYKNKPYEAKFTGRINGFEMNIAIPAIRKNYKLWKRNLIKTGGK